MLDGFFSKQFASDCECLHYIMLLLLYVQQRHWFETVFYTNHSTNRLDEHKPSAWNSREIMHSCNRANVRTPRPIPNQVIYSFSHQQWHIFTHEKNAVNGLLYGADSRLNSMVTRCLQIKYFFSVLKCLHVSVHYRYWLCLRTFRATNGQHIRI